MRFVWKMVAGRSDGGGPRISSAIVICACSILWSSGCATIVSGVSENIRFESDPVGATVTVDGGSYETPADVKLSRKRNHEAEFKLEGYLTRREQVLRSTNRAVFGNILIGGLIGILIDSLSGAVNDLEPDLVFVKLVKKDPVRKPDAMGELEAGDEDPDEPATEVLPAVEDDAGGDSF